MRSVRSSVARRGGTRSSRATSASRCACAPAWRPTRASRPSAGSEPDTKEGAPGGALSYVEPKERLGARGHRLAGRSGRRRRRVVELLLGPEKRVEDLVAQAFAQG